MFDDYDEIYNGTRYERTEAVPGVFGEYTFKGHEKWTVVAGLRGDYHNLYGAFATPRLHIRFAPTEKTTLRAAGGHGFRVANIFAENAAVFASARSLEIVEELQPEQAWNYGFNVTQKFNLNHREGSFSLDLYRTDFTNQVITDLFSTTDKILFYNLDGELFANSIQAELNTEIFDRWTVRLAYKFDDTRTTYNGQLINLPLQSRHKGLINTAYQTPNQRWRFDLTAQWYGTQVFD